MKPGSHLPTGKEDAQPKSTTSPKNKPHAQSQTSKETTSPAIAQDTPAARTRLRDKSVSVSQEPSDTETPEVHAGKKGERTQGKAGRRSSVNPEGKKTQDRASRSSPGKKRRDLDDDVPLSEMVKKEAPKRGRPTHKERQDTKEQRKRVKEKEEREQKNLRLSKLHEQREFAFFLGISSEGVACNRPSKMLVAYTANNPLS